MLRMLWWCHCRKRIKTYIDAVIKLQMIEHGRDMGNKLNPTTFNAILHKKTYQNVPCFRIGKHSGLQNNSPIRDLRQYFGPCLDYLGRYFGSVIKRAKGDLA